MIDIFLLDSFFAIVYLSFVESTVEKDDFNDRFRFLVQLLEREFVLDWDVEEQFNRIIEQYEAKNIIRRADHNIQLLVNMEGDAKRYEHLVFLASLMYPTIDAYWITSCSLSALEAVPMLPRCIVPMLTQWIATHLITGRRTLYREVLSTESSRTAVDVFMNMGFLTEIHVKEKLSPDAQILLHELGIPTSEVLIELSGQNSDGGKTPVSPIDPEGMMVSCVVSI
jgi:glycerol-3-phosphate O-acyltransferase